MSHRAVAARLAPLITSGAACTCGLIDLEVLYSARGAAEHRVIRRDRGLVYVRLPMEEADLRRALAVQGALAERGQHRVPIPDLLIAALAERHGVVVLHYDRDYDLIARVTGQPCEWVVRRGTVS
jgi:predicted nucleic acid-binding protein